MNFSRELGFLRRSTEVLLRYKILFIVCIITACIAATFFVVTQMFSSFHYFGSSTPGLPAAVSLTEGNDDSATTSSATSTEGILPPMQPATTSSDVVLIEPRTFQYIEIADGCGPYYGGTCLNARSGPGTEYPSVAKLRNGMVLKVAAIAITKGETWYKIKFDEGVLYPDRITDDWYVGADYVNLISNEGDKVSYKGVNASSTKKIIVKISEEMLYAYDGDSLFMQEPVSTGLELTPTAIGDFSVYKKTPSRYMQGPVPGLSDQFFDLPGVPWDLYFTYSGAVIHGAYWHDKFGQPWSHGCVNLPPEKAKILYEWAEIGTPVYIEQ